MSIKEEIQRENKGREILKGLKKEINLTLLFLTETDLNIYGHITKSVVECWKTQGVKFPIGLNELVEK